MADITEEEYEAGLPERFTAKAPAPEPEYTEADFIAEGEAIHGALSPVEKAGQQTAYSPRKMRELIGVGTTVEQKTTRERQMLEAEEEANAPSLGATFMTALESEWITSAQARAHERDTRSEFDPDWEITKDMVSQEQGYSDDEVRHLLGSYSKEDYEGRMGDISDDRERAQLLQRAGWVGTGAQFTMAMLDPAVIAAGIVTGGLANIGRASRMTKVLTGAGITATENAAIEHILMESDTQRGWESMVMAVLAGSLLGGGATAWHTRGSPWGKLDDINHTQSKDLQMDEAAEAMSHSQSQSHVGDLDDPKVTLRSQQELEVLNDVNRHTLDLGTRSGYRALSGKVKGKMKKSARALQTQIDELKASRTADVADFWSKTGVTKGVARQFDEARVSSITQRYDNKIDELSSQVEDINQAFSEDALNISSVKELKAWNKMTPEQKIKKLHPDYKRVDPVVTEKRASAATAKSDELEADYEGQFDSAHLDADPFEGQGTVGSARLKSPFEDGDPKAADMIEVMHEKTAHLDDAQNFRVFGKGKLGKYMNTDFTNLGHSESVDIRSLARTLLENAQGKNTGNSASVIAWVNDKLIRSAQGFRVERGYRQWAKEQKISNWNMATKPEYRDQFNIQVIQGVKNISKPPTSEGVKLAVQGVRDQLAKALEINQKSGVDGFVDEMVTRANPKHTRLTKKLSDLKASNKDGVNDAKIASTQKSLDAEEPTIQKHHKGIKQDDSYSPDIMDSKKVADMSIDSGMGMDKTRALISKGYQTGKNPLKKEEADMLATLKYNQAMNEAISQADPTDVFKARTAGDARALLLKYGIDAKDVDEFMQKILAKEDWATISNRAKASKGINWEAELGGHKISDIMDTNLDRQLEAYTKESAYNSALASKGIKSPGMMARILKEAKERTRETGTTESWAKSEQEFKVLEDNLTLMQGKSLVDYSGKYGSFHKFGRLVLDYTGLIRLQQMGFASMGELGRGIHAAGLTNILRACNESGAFKRMSTRDGKSLATQIESMKEVEEMIGFVGETNLMSSTTQRTDDFGSEARSVLGRNLDAGLEYGRRLNHFMSGFQTIQGGLEKVTANAINRKVLKVFKGGKANKTIKRALEDSGLPQARWDEISDWVKANGGKADFNGRSIDTWNFSKMDDSMQMDLRILMTRLNNRAMQKGMVGEANSSWLGAGGRFLTQFRMFSLQSLEKQLVHDVKGDKALAASMLTTSTALSYLAYSAQVQVRSAGIAAAGGDREAYVDEMLSGSNLHDGAFNKNNVLASAGVFRDMGAVLGVLPEEVMGEDRYGYLNQGRFSGAVPALGAVDDAVGLLGATGQMAYGRFRDDDTIGGDVQNLLKKSRKAVPFTNVMALGEFMNEGIDGIQ